MVTPAVILNDLSSLLTCIWYEFDLLITLIISKEMHWEKYFVEENIALEEIL